MSDLVQQSAVALAGLIRTGQVSCVEVMGAYLEQIAAHNPTVNAIVALRDAETLLAEARARDAEIRAGGALGRLHGFPLAVKDLEPVAGLRSTQGSPIFRDYIPTKDSVPVERLRRAGAIFVGKTNTPEFGLGSHTFNSVHGATGNAYDPARSAGGSSGGAAVALALRMAPVADGSDYGGSLRNPAGWNNVLGFRASPGRVASGFGDPWLPSMGMTGPMARSVDDLALLLRVQAGHDPRSPLSLDTDPGMFDGPFDRDWTGARIGWLGDFGGVTPCEPGLLDLCRGALSAFETIGCTVEETSIDFPADDAWRAYLTLRAWQTGGGLLPLYRQPARRALLKPEAIFEVEAGMRLSAYDITAASGVHAQWSEAVRRQFARFDFLIAPTAQMFPFPIEQDWPKTINGRSLETYCEWMKVACLVTLSGCPALAAPAGFSPSGLPIGIQIIGPGRSDRACLEIAHAYEQARDWTQRRQPPMLASPSVSRAG